MIFPIGTQYTCNAGIGIVKYTYIGRWAISVDSIATPTNDRMAQVKQSQKNYAPRNIGLGQTEIEIEEEEEEGPILVLLL